MQNRQTCKKRVEIFYVNVSLQPRDNAIKDGIEKLKEFSFIRNKIYNTLKEMVSFNKLTKFWEDIVGNRVTFIFDFTET